MQAPIPAELGVRHWFPVRELMMVLGLELAFDRDHANGLLEA